MEVSWAHQGLQQALGIRSTITVNAGGRFCGRVIRNSEGEEARSMCWPFLFTTVMVPFSAFTLPGNSSSAVPDRSRTKRQATPGGGPPRAEGRAAVVASKPV